MPWYTAVSGAKSRTSRAMLSFSKPLSPPGRWAGVFRFPNNVSPVKSGAPDRRTEAARRVAGRGNQPDRAAVPRHCPAMLLAHPIRRTKPDRLPVVKRHVDLGIGQCLRARSRANHLRGVLRPDLVRSGDVVEVLVCEQHVANPLDPGVVDSRAQQRQIGVARVNDDAFAGGSNHSQDKCRNQTPDSEC